MRLDLIERKVLRAVGITLALIAVIGIGLALWSRYRVFSEQKELELRHQFEQEMAQLMEEERLVEGMPRRIVRATLGPPDSTWGVGELVESWYYLNTKIYDEVMLRFERDRLMQVTRLGTEPIPPSGSDPPRSD
jgi:hypothetical protein